jgi:hypothetical protein
LAETRFNSVTVYMHAHFVEKICSPSSDRVSLQSGVLQVDGFLFRQVRQYITNQIKRNGCWQTKLRHGRAGSDAKPTVPRQKQTEKPTGHDTAAQHSTGSCKGKSASSFLRRCDLPPWNSKTDENDKNRRKRKTTENRLVRFEFFKILK